LKEPTTRLKPCNGNLMASEIMNFSN